MSRKLRRRGLRGNTAAVRFDGATLSVAGDTFGNVDIALPELRRVRIGMAQSGTSIYRQMLIWSSKGGAPLLVGTGDAAEHGRFASLVHALVDALARGGHAARIETGESKRWALFMMMLFGVQAAAFAGIALFVLGESEAALGIPRMVALVFPLLFLAGSLGAMAWAWSRFWPRRVRAPTDLDRVLPR